jgi:hypothetical protein
MSDAGSAVQKPPAARASAPEASQNRVTELKVSGHLMTLDAGLFCVFQAPGSPTANDQTGLPGVRISLPPGAVGRPESVSISTFRDDGWLNGQDAAALVRVAAGPAQVLVTVYQSPTATPNSAPRLQVMRLGPEAAADMPAQPAAPAAALENADVVVHVQRTGDTPSRIGDWAGTRGSRQWLEGFSLTPRDGLKPTDIEYQAVLGRGWMSPWIEGGKFCGSRGMALPLLGLKLRLKGAAAKTHECSYSASFVDGSAVGPVPAGETCEAESLAALEAFQVVINRRGAAAAPGAPPKGARTRAGQAAQSGARTPATKPATARPAADKPVEDKPKPARVPARTPQSAGSNRRSR